MDYKYLFYVKKCFNHSNQEREFLSKLLFNSVYTDECNLNRAMIDLSFNTKIKRSFNTTDKSKSQILIYYSSPIKITRIFTDLIQILEVNDDKYEYGFLTKSEKYMIIGNSRIGKLTHSQAHYINRLISTTDFTVSNVLPKPSKAPICNHYKEFPNERKV